MVDLRDRTSKSCYRRRQVTFQPRKPDTVTTIDPFKLTKEQDMHIKMLQDVLKVETDVKTNMTKVSVALQDPLAAAIVADSAVYKLQEYITDYRTRKAKQDYDFQLNLCEQYKKNTLQHNKSMPSSQMQTET